MLAMVLAITLQAAPQLAPAPEATIERGRELISTLKDEEALALLTPFVLRTDLAPALRARALIYCGIAHLNLAQEPEGRLAFRQSLEADPAASLPAWASRRVHAEFDAALAERAVAVALRRPEPPPPPAAPAPRVRVNLPLLITSAALVGLSGAGFLVWNGNYQAAKRNGSAAEAQRELGAANVSWYSAIGAGAAGLALGGVTVAVSLGSAR